MKQEQAILIAGVLVRKLDADLPLKRGGAIALAEVAATTGANEERKEVLAEIRAWTIDYYAPAEDWHVIRRALLAKLDKLEEVP